MGGRKLAQIIWLGAVASLVAACSLLGSSVDGFSGGQSPNADAGCPSGNTVCGALCVDTASNAQNCGACGKACAQGEACTAGQCKIACPGGQVECNGLCFELSNDVSHCGRCDTKCNPGEVCGNGKCSANCPTGQTNCGGSCADLQTDAKHCGRCDVACGTNEECVGGKCAIACRTQLNQTITDPWGWSWDGLERAATSWDTARATCEGFRGRLPTATELYRVSATQSATVGQTIHMNYLWSLVPYGGQAHVDVRLSDASTGSTPDVNALNYRCVCPPALPSVFTGHNCNGAAGSECYALDGEGKRRNTDAKDRAPLHKGGALWECSFYHAHLMTPLALTEAIQQGMVPGTGAWLHTADEVNYATDSVLRWSDGVGFVYQYTSGGPNSVSWVDTAGFYSFRCAGENYAAGAHPATIPNEWTSPLGQKGETKDTAPTTYIDAVDQCWTRGGHLPFSSELGSLIEEGLPNGSGNWLWTADETGYEGTQFTVAVKQWTGTDTRHLYYHNKNAADLSWVYKHQGAYAFRCIYYPVDTTYAGPPAASCAGGCTTFTLPGASGAKMWLDSFDRAPALTTTQAIDACRKLGGHLPSERDLTEAIRHGLLNGSGQFLWTADAEIGTSTSLQVGVVKWTGAAPQFTSMYPADMTWDGTAASHAYRCLWTNELR